jgi:universal stress protein A
MKAKSAKEPHAVVVELDEQDTERLSKFAMISPLKLKKILVPVDLSNGSRKAVQYAVPFAKHFNASIVFLHVVPGKCAFDEELGLDGFTPGQKAGLQEDAALKLKALAREWVPPQIPVQIETAQGAQVMEIVSMAQKLNADLIIVSTHGRTGRAHELVGSRAENIVQLAPCPVLVVREQERDFIGGKTMNQFD